MCGINILASEVFIIENELKFVKEQACGKLQETMNSLKNLRNNMGLLQK